MTRFKRSLQGATGGDETVVGTVVRPPLGQSAVIPHGAEIGGYRIGPQLGRGGMGVVYKAHHVRLDRSAAVKVLTPALAGNEDFRERFIRESQMAATLQHPNVITVYDAGEEDGLLYLAMQFVPGTDLRRLLELEGPLDATRALMILAQVASALDTAHARGLVHRDVKPANVLVDMDHAYLGDFGLTKRLGASGGLTGVGQIVGTVEYLAPEQIEGEHVDGRSDVYALGCVVYECLAGRPPHSKDSDIATLFAHVREEQRPLSEIVEGVPVAADEVVGRALAKSPDDRYQSCRELIFDLAVALEVDVAQLTTQEASSRVVVASADGVTRAVVRGSLANMGVAVAELDRNELPSWIGDRRFDAIIVDTGFGAEALAALREAVAPPDGSPGPAVLLLVPHDPEARAGAQAMAADAELAQPFSGMQLALRLQRLLGPQAVRA